MPLEMRIQDSAFLNYWVNLQGDSQEHPNTNHYKTMVGKGEKRNKNIWLDTHPRSKVTAEVKVQQLSIIPAVLLLAVPPWIHPDATVDFTVLKYCKSTVKVLNKDKESMHNSFITQEYINRYHGYIQIYTDASKLQVGGAFILPVSHIKLVRGGSMMKFQFTQGKYCYY